MSKQSCGNHAPALLVPHTYMSVSLSGVLMGVRVLVSAVPAAVMMVVICGCESGSPTTLLHRRHDCNLKLACTDHAYNASCHLVPRTSDRNVVCSCHKLASDV